MNWKALNLALAMICSIGIACASSAPKSDDAVEEPPITSCAEPRPQACTMEYIPVCGHRYDGERKTYPNACSACSDSDVSGRDPGPCEEPDPEPDDPAGSESTE
jgi:hypothetical protein